MKGKGLVLGVSAILFFFLNGGFSFAHAAFGVSPPAFRAVNVVKGSRYAQIIYLVRDRAEEELKIQVKFEINERVRKWFSINKGEEIVIPKGVRQFPVEVVLKVPKDAGLGAYNGSLTFMGMPDKTGQVTIALGAEVLVDVAIGEGIYRKFNIALVDLLDIEEGWSPRVRVKFNNEGNVPETVNRATYELYDQFGAARLAYIQKNEDFPEIPPFTISDEIIEFPLDLHLGLGQYWGSVSIVKDDNVIATQRTVFDVLKAGSLSGSLTKIVNSIKQYKAYYGVGVLVGVGIFLMALRKRKKRSRS